MDSQDDKPGDLKAVLKPFALPMGLASPMWIAAGAAATVSASWWWMTRWTWFAAPNLYARTPVPVAPTPTPEVVQEALAGVVETTTLAPPLEEIPAEVVFSPPSAEVVPEAPEAHAEPEPLPMRLAQPAPEIGAPDASMAERPDELTLLRGVGPRVADALVARGVTTFAQLAAWSDHDLAKFDAEMKLLGRSKRYDFLGQAREMAEKV